MLHGFHAAQARTREAGLKDQGSRLRHMRVACLLRMHERDILAAGTVMGGRMHAQWSLCAGRTS